VLYAVDAACWAAAAGDDEGERSRHHGHTVLVQRQEFVHGDGELVQVCYESSLHVEDNLDPITPYDAFDSSQGIINAIRDFWLIGLIVLLKKGADLRGAGVETGFGGIHQVADGQIWLTDETDIKGGIAA